jgi:hypothetical protein
MATALSVVLCAPWALADEPAQDPAAADEARDLDDALLESLGEDDPLPPDEVGADDGDAASDADPLDEELLRGLEDGEGIGEQPDRIADIGRRMRQVEERIAGADSGEQTQDLQRGIAADLEVVIEELIKQMQQAQQQQGASGRMAGTMRRRVSQPQVGQGQQPGAQQGPARESTDAIKPDQLDAVKLGQMSDVVKHEIMHLPARVREQMSQHADEKFLPLYQQMIGDYFRSLAELPDSTP